MVSDDAAAFEVVTGPGGIRKSLPKGGIHVCAGTHSVAAIEKLAAIHAGAGQVLIATPVLGRPEAVVGGAAGILVGGPPQAVEHCRPLFAAIAGRVVDAGADPVTAAAIKIANNFVLGCAIEAMGEGFSLVRKYGVAPDVFYRVLTEGPFACWAYKTYGQFIAEERYLPAGQRAVNGLKDANLALAAGERQGRAVAERQCLARPPGRRRRPRRGRTRLGRDGARSGARQRAGEVGAAGWRDSLKRHCRA